MMCVMVLTRRQATAVVGIVLLVEAVGIGAAAVSDARLVERGYGDQFEGLTTVWAWSWVVLIAVPGIVGAVIVRSQPRQPVGWLFVTLSVSLFAAGMCEEWFTLAAVVQPPEVGGAGVAAVLADKSFYPWWPLLTVILLLTPTGTYLSGRWRLVGRTTVGATVVCFLLSVTGSDTLGEPYDRVDNPFLVEATAGAARAVAAIVFAVVAVGLLLGALSLVLRWRAATGDARRQLMWLTLVAVPLPAVIPMHLYAVATDSDSLTLVTLLLFLAVIPVAAGLSVLRFRLYDVDRIVAATFTYSFLWLVLASIYAGIVWAGSQASTFTSPSPAATATVGAITAAALAAPLRGIIQRRVDRRFNRRAYDAVRVVREAVMIDRAGIDPESLLRTALADDSVGVSYPVSNGWVDGVGAAAPLRSEHVAVVRGGMTVARIAFDPARVDRSTVVRVGQVAAAELDNMRLRAELQSHLGYLEESRARIADAQHAERRRIERDLHDGAQQSLLALAYELQSARLNGEPERMRAALETGVASARNALRELRDLANGLHPQALVEGGLTAILDDLAQRSSVPVQVACPRDRLPATVEFTCWLVIAEAVVNAQKHADARRIVVQVVRRGDAVSLRVDDDGRGGADAESAGLRGLRDRVGAARGSLRVETSDQGTTIEAVIPCAS